MNEASVQEKTLEIESIEVQSTSTAQQEMNSTLEQISLETSESVTKSTYKVRTLPSDHYSQGTHHDKKLVTKYYEHSSSSEESSIFRISHKPPISNISIERSPNENNTKSTNHLRVHPLDSTQHDQIFNFKHANTETTQSEEEEISTTRHHYLKISEESDESLEAKNIDELTTIHHGLKIHKDESHEIKDFQNFEHHHPKSSASANKNMEMEKVNSRESNKILIANSIESVSHPTISSSNQEEEIHITTSSYANGFSKYPEGNGYANKVMSNNIENTSEGVAELNSNPILVENLTSSTSNEIFNFMQPKELNENATDIEGNEVKLNLNESLSTVNNSLFNDKNDINETKENSSKDDLKLHQNFTSIQISSESILPSNESINKSNFTTEISYTYINLTTALPPTSIFVSNSNENATTSTFADSLQNSQHSDNVNSSEPQIQYLNASRENPTENQPRNLDDHFKPPSFLPSNRNKNKVSMSAANNGTNEKLPLDQQGLKITSSTAANDTEVQAKNTQINLLTDTKVNKKHSTVIGNETGFKKFTTKKSNDATDIGNDPSSTNTDKHQKNVNDSSKVEFAASLNSSDSFNSTTPTSMSDTTTEELLDFTTTKRKKLRKIKKSRTITTTTPMTIVP